MGWGRSRAALHGRSQGIFVAVTVILSRFGVESGTVGKKLFFLRMASIRLELTMLDQLDSNTNASTPLGNKASIGL